MNNYTILKELQRDVNLKRLENGPKGPLSLAHLATVYGIVAENLGPVIDGRIIHLGVSLDDLAKSIDEPKSRAKTYLCIIGIKTGYSYIPLHNI